MTFQIFDKFKRDVIFEVIVIDTINPTGQCSIENFRTSIISVISVDSIMKRGRRELRLSAGAENRSLNISLFQK